MSQETYTEFPHDLTVGLVPIVLSPNPALWILLSMSGKNCPRLSNGSFKDAELGILSSTAVIRQDTGLYLDKDLVRYGSPEAGLGDFGLILQNLALIEKDAPETGSDEEVKR